MDRRSSSIFGSSKDTVKVQYDIIIKQISGLPKSAGGVYSVEWKRGSKDENHGVSKSVQVSGKDPAAVFNELVNITCTLFRDPKKGFEEKNVVFTIKETASGAKKASSIGKVAIDLAEFANSKEERTRTFPIKESKGKGAISLIISFKTIWVAENGKRIKGAGDTSSTSSADEITETDGITDAGHSDDEEDLEDFPDDDAPMPASSSSSSISSSTSKTTERKSVVIPPTSSTPEKTTGARTSTTLPASTSSSSFTTPEKTADKSVISPVTPPSVSAPDPTHPSTTTTSTPSNTATSTTTTTATKDAAAPSKSDTNHAELEHKLKKYKKKAKAAQKELEELKTQMGNADNGNKDRDDLTRRLAQAQEELRDWDALLTTERTRVQGMTEAAELTSGEMAQGKSKVAELEKQLLQRDEQLRIMQESQEKAAADDATEKLHNKVVDLSEEVYVLKQERDDAEEAHKAKLASLTAELEAARNQAQDKGKGEAAASEKTIDELSKKVKSLEDELQRASSAGKSAAQDADAKKALQTQLDAVKKDLEERDSELERANRDVTALEEDLYRLRADAEQLTSENADLKSKVASSQENEDREQESRAEVEELRQRLKDAETEAERVQQDASKVQADLDAAQKAREQTEADLEAAKKAREQAQADLEAAKNAMEQAQADIERMKEERDTTREEAATAASGAAQVEDLHRQLADATGNAEALQSSIQKAKDEAEANATELEEARSVAITMEQERDKLQSELEEARERMTKLEEEAERSKEEAKRLREEVRSLESGVAQDEQELKDRIRTLEGEQGDLRAEIARLQASHKEEKQKSQSAASSLAEQQQALETQRAEAEAVQAQLDERDNDVSALKQQVDTLQARLDEETEEKEGFKAQLEAALAVQASAAAGEDAESAAQLAQLRQDVADSKKQAKKLKGKLESATQERDDAEAEVERLRVELQEHTQTHDAEISKLREELSQSSAPVASAAAVSVAPGPDPSVIAELEDQVNDLQRELDAEKERVHEATERADTTSKRAEERASAAEGQCAKLSIRVREQEEEINRLRQEASEKKNDKDKTKDVGRGDKNEAIILRREMEENQRVEAAVYWTEVGFEAGAEDTAVPNCAASVWHLLSSVRAFEPPNDKLFSKIVAALDRSFRRAVSDDRMLSYWLATTTSLLECLVADGHIPETASAATYGIQVVPGKFVQSPGEGVLARDLQLLQYNIYSEVVANVTARLAPLILTAFFEQSDAPPKGVITSPKSPRPRSPITPRSTNGHTSNVHHPALSPTINSVNSVLGQLLSTLKDNQLPSPIVQQFFQQVMLYIDGTLLNHMLEHKSLCTPSVGFHLKMGCSRVDEWLAKPENHGVLPSGAALQHVKEASNVLVLDKALFLDAEVIESIFHAINLVQVKKLLDLFTPDAMSPGAVPSNVRSMMESDWGHPTHMLAIAIDTEQLINYTKV